MPNRALVTSLNTDDIKQAIVDFLWNKYAESYLPREVELQYHDTGMTNFGRPMVNYTATVSKQPNGKDD